VADLVTSRLLLPLIDAGHVAAVTSGHRREEWAEDFPAEGDIVIARMLAEDGIPAGDGAAFGSRLVVERSTGLVVGGVGFLGPPADGSVEFGYGIVPSRQGRGYATEAAAALVAFGLALPGVREVVAHAEEANPASVRVLEKAGLVRRGRDGSLLEFAATRA
jgi:[ribosomal protein S5]-alanine N-acetyltransferase